MKCIAVKQKSPLTTNMQKIVVKTIVILKLITLKYRKYRKLYGNRCSFSVIKLFRC